MCLVKQYFIKCLPGKLFLNCLTVEGKECCVLDHEINEDHLEEVKLGPVEKKLCRSQ
jgi:hypothetical protein